MSNTICIKHGAGQPDGKLQPYELGYSDNGALYIGYYDESKKANMAKKLIDTAIYEMIKIQKTINIGEIKNGDWCDITFNLPTNLISKNNDAKILVDSPFEVSMTKFGFNTPYYIGNEETYCVAVFKSGSPYQLRCIANDKLLYNLSANPLQKLIISEGNYGLKDPNTAGLNGEALPGVPGQLYFVITG